MTYLFTPIEYVTKPITQAIYTFDGQSKKIKDNIFDQSNDMDFLEILFEMILIEI